MWFCSILVCISLTNGAVLGQARNFNLNNRGSASYEALGDGSTVPLNATSDLNVINGDRLIDPLGQILDCGGNEFADYTGFSVGLFESKADGVGDVGALVKLTPTNPPNTVVPEGIVPNILNSNPYSVTNAPVNGRRGVYNFLLSTEKVNGKSQIDVGQTYILLISAPTSLGVADRLVQLKILSNVDGVLSYVASSLDGRPIGADGLFTTTGNVLIKNAEQQPLSLIALQLNAASCETRELQIIKTGDRAAAEPGDIASYRLAIKNLTKTVLSNIKVADTLPLGFNYVPNSAIAAFRGSRVPVVVTESGRNLGFEVQTDLAVGSDEIQLAYAVAITPDAVRGSGRNAAIASAKRSDNPNIVRDGPAIFTMRIRPGIVSDCATLIGRVFVDKNFDGEQQNGEPGVPNAVIYMDDGNRIVTDANGIYSMANVIPGSRTLALDISSLPGYTLAPNLYFIERNSQSRLVRLAPGGLGRANFGVTPAFRGVEGQK
ncbi:MAG: hypothetical protein AUK48_11465 [Oscillatoriales cyanobacterium CG2_30_44_21]|nr:MAG: hypothetical protein AUK48_11465 [Oscillatoriales cyanobacterium CG2_30_44_21]